nr:immunoglobulin heavy chain junction region [Mus musculus]MBK4188611.1 immunoglobulin heavy chain junction region [Mus musculus]
CARGDYYGSSYGGYFDVW